MKTVVPLLKGTTQQRLFEEADRLGDADGVCQPDELQRLVDTMAARGCAEFDEHGMDRLRLARQLAAQKSVHWAYLDPELQKLPAPLRRLAVEVDELWGNADGRISAEELERVARYYLSALPLFTREAGLLMELAHHLHLDQDCCVPGVLALRVALSKVDNNQVKRAQPFRALFDAALAEADAPGAPELLREAVTHNTRWHRLSVLEHSALVVDAVADLCGTVGVPWKDGACAMFLHDVGKILDRQVQREGDTTRFSFWDHEAVGAEWLKSKGVSDELVFMVRYHGTLRGKTVEEMKELCGGDKERMARMMVLYVADQVAKGDTHDQLASFREQKPHILELCAWAGVDGHALLQRSAELRRKYFPQSGTP